MDTFDDVRTGHDLELLLDEQLLKAFVAVLFDAEPAVRLTANAALIKEFGEIFRSYNPDGSSAAMPGGTIRLLSFPETPEYFYLVLNVVDMEVLKGIIAAADPDIRPEDLDFLGELGLVIRLGTRLLLPDLKSDLLQARRNQRFAAHSDTFRIEGLAPYRIQEDLQDPGTLVAPTYASEQEFLTSLRGLTVTVLDFLPDDLQELFPEHFRNVLDQNPTGRREAGTYEVLLEGFHRDTVSLSLRSLLRDADVGSFYVPASVSLVPFSEARKLGIYGDFSLSTMSVRNGDTAQAVDFTSTSPSGIALNLSESLARALFFALIRLRLEEALEDGEISQRRFDDISFTFPFVIPNELLDRNGRDGEDFFFEIDRLEMTTGNHRYPERDGKFFGLHIKLILSNRTSNVWGDLLDFATPNPRIHFHLAFNNTTAPSELLIDADIKVPLSAKTFLVEMVSPLNLLSATRIGTGVTNIVIDSRDSLKFAIDPVSLRLTPTVLRKRWDPFYYTLHQLLVNLEGGTINESGQLKVDFSAAITRDFEPVEQLYLSEVDADEAGINSVRYRFRNLDDLLTGDLPATSRIRDFYNRQTYNDEERPLELFVSIQDINIDRLNARRDDNKILTHIPYIPRFARRENGSVTLLWAVSKERQSQVKRELLTRYVEAQVEDFVSYILDFVVELVPDFDSDAVTDDQLKELRRKTRGLIEDSKGFLDYDEFGWEDDFTRHLRMNEGDLLRLSPEQFALLGVNSDEQEELMNALQLFGLSPDELFDFLDLPGYVAIALGGQIFIRALPNQTVTDNIATLPEYEPLIELELPRPRD